MAAMSAEQLAARLTQGKPVAAVLLLGSDAYLRETFRERIIEATVEASARPWAVQRYSGEEDDLTEVLGRAQTMPMLAPRQVIVVTHLEGVEQQGEARREAAVKALTDYLAGPAPFTVLVLEAAVLDQRMKLGKLLADKAIVLPAELPEKPEERLPMATSFTLRIAGEREASIDHDAAELLADLCNCDLAAVRMEIDKLATYAGAGQKISRADVEALVVAEKNHSVWELAETVAAGRREEALKFLDRLLRDGEQAPAMVGALAWMYRRLLELQELPPGTSAGQAAGRLRMRQDVAKKAIQQARKIPRGKLIKGLSALYEADSRLKSGAKDPRLVMEFLLAEMVGGSAG